MHTFKCNAGWEIRDGRSICRYFIAWNDNGFGQIAGTIAGYSGGGDFVMEPFFAAYEAGKLTSLIIDMDDFITGEDVSFFDDVSEEMRALADDAGDLIWEWNDREAWEESDQLVLLEGKAELLSHVDDLLLMQDGTSPYLSLICEAVGLTAKPS